jgi:hypothetical protein
MTITVDGCGYERAALSPGQRQAPPIEALWYQAWRLSAKGRSTKKAKAADKKLWAVETDPPPTTCSSLFSGKWYGSQYLPCSLGRSEMEGAELKPETHALQASPTSAPYKLCCFSRQ